MAEMNPREVIESYDDHPGRDRFNQPNGSVVQRTILYANGTEETYEYDDRNPPPTNDVAWGTRIGSRVDQAQKRTWDEEVKAQRDAHDRPTSPTPTGSNPARLDTPAIILNKIQQQLRAGVPPDEVAGNFSSWDLTTGKLLSGGSGGSGSGGGSRGPTVSALATAAKTEALLPGELVQQGLTAEKTRLDIDALKQKALPSQQQLLQQAQQTIDFIGKQIESGVYTPDQAAGYFKQVNDYVTTGLQGSTPYEVWKEQQKAITDRAKQATDILNQRMQSGASLAASLNRDHTTALTANGGLLVNPGSYDPIEDAKATVNELGGGDRTAAIAKALLEPLMNGGSAAPVGMAGMGMMGLGGGDVLPPLPAPAGELGATVTDAESVLAALPDPEGVLA